MEDQSLDIRISTSTLLKFALPTIISMVFMGIYSTVDGVFVSQLVGTNALSAINIVMPIFTVALAVGTMFSAGGSAIVGKKLGEGKGDEARENFSFLILVTFILSCLIALGCTIWLRPLLHFLGANEALMSYCFNYASVILIFVPLIMVGVVFQMFFITAGKATLGLWVSVAGGVTNIVLDYVFIAVLDMGLAGAAIATGIGYALQGVCGFVYFLVNRKGGIYLCKPKWDGGVILKSCSNGASEMVSTLSAGVVTLLLNNILMKMAGPDGVAAITIILYAQGLLATIYMGYAMGIAPLISYNYGKQDNDNIKGIYKISLKTIIIASLVTIVFSLVCTEVLVGIFATKPSAVYDMATYGYRMFSICFLFMGINIFSSSMFTALSDGKVSAILSFFRTLIFVVAMCIVMPSIFGIKGVWMAIPIAELLGLFMSVYYFKKLKGKYNYM